MKHQINRVFLCGALLLTCALNLAANELVCLDSQGMIRWLSDKT